MITETMELIKKAGVQDPKMLAIIRARIERIEIAANMEGYSSAMNKATEMVKKSGLGLPSSLHP